MNMIKIQTGDLFVNTYIIHAESSKECIVIDPGGSYDKINNVLTKYELVPKVILLTHGHFDHIGAVNELKEGYSSRVMIHKDDANMLTDSKKNLSAFLFKDQVVCQPADETFEQQEIICCGITVTIIHTPGHSPGGVVFLMGNVAFTGDTLFNMSIGRADFLGCDEKKLNESLKKLKDIILPEYQIFPGHGTESTFDYELKNNPYLKG
jgi:hydroxyacylglutathione hydrolase